MTKKMPPKKANANQQSGTVDLVKRHQRGTEPPHNCYYYKHCYYCKICCSSCYYYYYYYYHCCCRVG